MRKIRVAHVITRLCKGGAQENTFHTVRLANRDRFDVDLITGQIPSNETSIEDTMRAAGVDIIREPHLVRPISLWNDWLALRSLTALFKEKRYDIVHTHTSKAGFLGRIAARRANAKIIVHTPHGNIFHGYFSKPMTKLLIAMERHVARDTHRIIELTPGGIEEHMAEGIGRREQYVSIFSGIDLQPYDSAIAHRDETRRALGIAPEHVLIGGVGRLEPVKGFPHFVEAAYRIADAHSNARFVLAGDGTLREALEQRAADLGERFQFLGLRHDVPDLMAAMDVFVLPSINEGMGRVLLEAGAAGTPVVASNVGGVADIVTHGETGILVPPRKPIRIAEAVCALIEDSDLRRKMGQAARAKVCPHYGLENMVAQLEALYEELIKEMNIDA